MGLSIFSNHQDREHLDGHVQDVMDKLPKNSKGELVILLGCFEQTILNGFQKDNQKVIDNPNQLLLPLN